MPAAQTPEFKKAVEDSRTLTQKPTNDELLEVRHARARNQAHCHPDIQRMLTLANLQIYGLFKQGTQEQKFEDATAPGMFDLKVSSPTLPQDIRTTPNNGCFLLYRARPSITSGPRSRT